LEGDEVDGVAAEVGGQARGVVPGAKHYLYMDMYTVITEGNPIEAEFITNRKKNELDPLCKRNKSQKNTN
jgi:hypothetical protein